jgi:hypothetical protein
MVGRYSRYNPRSFYETERLLEELKYYGISDALIFHSLSMEHSPKPGNQYTLRESLKHPNLHPVWSFLPLSCGETSEPKVILENMRNANSRVARLFPRRFYFDLEDLLLDGSFEVFAKHRIPVIIDFLGPPHLSSNMPSQIEWKKVFEVCQSYPDLPVIVSEFRTWSNRRMYQFMEKCPNLHVEISSLWSPFRLIEDLCRRFGAKRLIFGTRLPIRNPAGTLGMVNYSLISESEKRLIAGENLQKLMEAVCFD